MKKKTLRSLFGSGRSRYFKEPKRVSYVRRSQKVRFRRRAAASMAKSVGLSAFRLSQVGVAAALLLVGGKKGYEFWQASPTIRVEKVLFQGPIPKTFPEKIGIRSGDNIFVLEGGKREEEALKKFPELRNIRITRRVDKTVLVEVERRVPVATFVDGERALGVDNEGVIFPLLPAEVQGGLPRIKAAWRPDVKTVLTALSTWKKSVPEFYSMVKSVETDKMHNVTLGLAENVTVRWGAMDEATLVKKAKNILTLRQNFAPRVAGAELRVITDDRIVMDQKWMRISINNE